MSTFERWEEIRAACEVLHDLALAQVEQANYPDASTVAAWLDHVGSVAAVQGTRAGALLAGCESVYVLPPCGALQ